MCTFSKNGIKVLNHATLLSSGCLFPVSDQFNMYISRIIFQYSILNIYNTYIPIFYTQRSGSTQSTTTIPPANHLHISFSLRLFLSPSLSPRASNFLSLSVFPPSILSHSYLSLSPTPRFSFTPYSFFSPSPPITTKLYYISLFYSFSFISLQFISGVCDTISLFLLVIFTYLSLSFFSPSPFYFFTS